MKKDSAQNSLHHFNPLKMQHDDLQKYLSWATGKINDLRKIVGIACIQYSSVIQKCTLMQNETYGTQLTFLIDFEHSSGLELVIKADSNLEIKFIGFSRLTASSNDSPQSLKFLNSVIESLIGFPDKHKSETL